MAHWVRFERDGETGIGMLEGETIAVCEGDLFASAPATGATVAVEDVILQTPCVNGTEVRMFLPSTRSSTTTQDPMKDDEPIRGQGEVILVLEDDPDVRHLAVTSLKSLGYRVLEASDAKAAEKELAAAHKVDLLLSDVVLRGGVSGPEFALNARSLYPQMKVVFMTGYAPEHAANHNFGELDTKLLNKPFRRADLAQVLHDALAH
jgi:CheY-like chemotaxis protein